MSRSNVDSLEETTQPKDWEMCESEERRHAPAIIGRSPFSAYFQQVMQEVKEQVAGDETWSVRGQPILLSSHPHCPLIPTVPFFLFGVACCWET